MPQSAQSQSVDIREPTRFEVSGIFNWVRTFEGGFDDDANYFGWNFAFNGNLTEHFGLKADVFGNYWNSPVSLVGLNHHGLEGSPRFSFPCESVTPFVHFLVGSAHARADILGVGID
jgi:hypothetical protein